MLAWRQSPSILPPTWETEATSLNQDAVRSALQNQHWHGDILDTLLKQPKQNRGTRRFDGCSRYCKGQGNWIDRKFLVIGFDCAVGSFAYRQRVKSSKRWDARSFAILLTRSCEQPSPIPCLKGQPKPYQVLACLP